MKLYANIETDKAKESKGGNEFIEITVSEKNRAIAHIQTWYENKKLFLKITDCIGNEIFEDITKAGFLLATPLKAKKHIHDWDRYGKCVDCGKWDHNEKLKAKKQKGECNHGEDTVCARCADFPIV